MNSRTLLNLGLLVLVGILVALAIWEPGKEAPPGPKPLTELNPAEVDRVRIERAGQAAVAAERNEDGSWRLTEPRPLPANDYRFDSLVSVAKAPDQGGFPVRDELDAFGLAEPRVRLQLNDLTLDFGNTTPVDQRRYVRVGDTVHLIGDTHYYHLIGGIGTFASRRLLPEDGALTAISLPKLELHQQKGKWSVAPEAAEASADDIAKLVDNWRHARAIEVKSWDEPAPQGETIRIHLAGTTAPVQFVIASREPQTVLVRPDWQLAYHLPDSVTEELLSLGSAEGKKR